MIVFSQQLCLSIFNFLCELWIQMRSPSCLPIFTTHCNTNALHVFLPFSEPIFIFIGIYTVKCMLKLRTPRAFHLQTAAPHQPPLIFYLSVFFSPEGQYEIIRQPSMLTSVWIYSWCSLEMPGNKSLLSHRPVALVPVHFSSPPAEREERQGRENERTRCPRRWN